MKLTSDLSWQVALAASSGIQSIWTRAIFNHKAITYNICNHKQEYVHAKRHATQDIKKVYNYAWYKWFKINTIVEKWLMIICLDKSL